MCLVEIRVQIVPLPHGRPTTARNANGQQALAGPEYMPADGGSDIVKCWTI